MSNYEISAHADCVREVNTLMAQCDTLRAELEELALNNRNARADTAKALAELDEARADAKQWAEKAGDFTADWMKVERELAAFRTHHLAETSRLTREVLELRADSEALAKVMQEIYDDSIDHVVTQLAQEALAAYRSRHTAPVKTP